MESSSARDRIELWEVDLAVDSEALERLALGLASDEMERASRFRFPDDRRRFIVTRSALRSVLARDFRTPASRLYFEYSEHGKPELPRAHNPHDVRFSVTHSGDAALIAVTRGAPIGVDVERVRALDDRTALVERYFSAEERAALAALPTPERHRAFFACWTRKEAFLKATGEGLSRALDSFTVTVSPADPPRILHVDGRADAADTWCLTDVSPPGDYVATLAVRRIGGQLVKRHWTPKDIR